MDGIDVMMMKEKKGKDMVAVADKVIFIAADEKCFIFQCDSCDVPFWNLKMTLLDIKIKAFIVTKVLLLCHNYVCNISIKIRYGAVNEFFDERKQKILKFRDNLSLKIKMLICTFFVVCISPYVLYCHFAAGTLR